MIKKLILLLFLIFAFKGCTRDDICPEGTATTANLIIIFKDKANPDNRKKVEDLSVFTDYVDSVLVFRRAATDSIVIPLSTTSDTTKYRFIRTKISETDTVINVDKVMFIYSRRDSYVNRACGFKTEFDNLTPILENEGIENWIQNITTNRDTIIDEQKAHLTFFH